MKPSDEHYLPLTGQSVLSRLYKTETKTRAGKQKKEVQVVLTLLKASRKKLFVRNNQLDSEGCGECEDLIGGESLRRHHWPALLETPPSPQC